MSDSNRTGLSYVEETNWGVTPAAALKNLRFTGESLSFAKETTQSAIIRSDRQKSAPVLTGFGVSGGYNFEFAAKELDDLMEGAFWSSWTKRTNHTGITDLTFAATGQTVTSAAQVTDFNTYLEAGQWIKFTGTSEAANMTYHEVDSVTTNVITVVGTLADETPASVSVTAEIQNDDLSVDADGGVDSGYALISAANVDWTKQKLAVDQWIKIAGFTTVANNGLKKVLDITATTLTLASVTTMVDEASGDTVTVTATDTLINGTEEHSYTLERVHEDTTPDQTFFTYQGEVVNTFNLDTATKAIITGSFDFIGKGMPIDSVTGKPKTTTTSAGTGTNITAETTDSMNTVDNIGFMMLNGSQPAQCLVNAFNFSLANNVRAKDALGVLGACDVGVGEIGVTGSVTLHFNNPDYYNEHLAHSEMSFYMITQDADSNYYIWCIPAFKTDTDTVNTGGANQDVMENIGIMAYMHETLGHTIRVEKILA